MLELGTAQALHDVYMADPTILKEAGFNDEEIANIKDSYPTILQSLLTLETYDTLNLMLHTAEERIAATERDIRMIRDEMVRRNALPHDESESPTEVAKLREERDKRLATALRRIQLGKAQMYRDKLLNPQ